MNELVGEPPLRRHHRRRKRAKRAVRYALGLAGTSCVLVAVVLYLINRPSSTTPRAKYPTPWQAIGK